MIQEKGGRRLNMTANHVAKEEKTERKRKYVQKGKDGGKNKEESAIFFQGISVVP